MSEKMPETQGETNKPTRFKKAATKLIKRQQSKYEKPINAIWELFSDYSNSSTVHGVRYLGEKRRHWTERIWWIIAFALSLFGCGKLILDTWNKWNQFPVIVTFAERSTPVWDIPFPAVTICPQTKSRQTILNYTLIYNKAKSENMSLILTEEELAFMTAASKICDPHSFIEKLAELEGNTSDPEVFKHLRKVAPNLSRVMYDCRWKQRSCKKLFSNIWTEEGLCFTFNMLNSSDIYRTEILNPNFETVTHNFSSENWQFKGYNRNVNENQIYPFRVFGASDGLRINLQLFELDFDYLCSGPVQGFKLLLHTPEEIPQISKYYYRIPLDHEVILSVKPNLMTTSETLQQYNPERRQCYFEWERYLKYFKIYTQRNCELECITNATIKRCGCASFAMPRETSTQICGLAMLKCYRSVESKLFKRDAAGNFTGCNCLPACRSILYDAELSFAKYDLREVQHAKGKTQLFKKQYAQIFISFKDNQVFASRRSELYGGTDFLANCGGLLGLFMGVSLLSVVEAIYYCTLRLGCNLRKRRLKKRKRLALHNSQNNDNNVRF